MSLSEAVLASEGDEWFSGGCRGESDVVVVDIIIAEDSAYCACYHGLVTDSALLLIFLLLWRRGKAVVDGFA